MQMNSIPHRKEGEVVLLDSILIIININNDCQEGTRYRNWGWAFNKIDKRNNCYIEELVGLDISPFMIKAVEHNFLNDSSVKVVEHD